jgi:hypothetical protein
MIGCPCLSGIVVLLNLGNLRYVFKCVVMMIVMVMRGKSSWWSFFHAVVTEVDLPVNSGLELIVVRAHDRIPVLIRDCGDA